MPGSAARSGPEGLVTRVEVHAGVCGFTARVEVEREAGALRVVIRSGCAMVSRLGERIGRLLPAEAAARFSENPVFRTAEGCIAHASCPVLAGVLKAVEVEAGLALPGDSWIRFVDG